VRVKWLKNQCFYENRRLIGKLRVKKVKSESYNNEIIVENDDLNVKICEK